jgi:hypothetical protein
VTRVQPTEFFEPYSGDGDEPTANGQSPLADFCDDPENWPCREWPSCPRCNARPVRCHATSRRTGEICGFPARSEHAFCINHDPEYQAIQRQNSSAGGHNSGASRRSLSVHSLNVWLGDRAGIQAALDTVVRLELLGRISPARSRNIIRALAIAARNFDDPRRPRRDYDAEGYGSYREILDADLDLALDEARANDTPPPRMPPPLPRRLSLTDLWSALQ